MRKYIALVLLPILLGSCSSDKEENFDDTIIINIDAKQSVGKYDVSNLLGENYSIVPLETSDSSLIGSIDKIEMKGDYIYILDILGNSVLKYHKNGTYKDKLFAMGQGPGEYIGITDMTVTDSSIVVIDRFSLKRIEYDSDTYSVLSENWILKDDIWAMAIFNLSNTIYYINDWGNETHKFRLFKENKETYSFDKYLEYDAIPPFLAVGNYQQHYAVNKDEALVVYNASDYIYKINQDGIQAKYKVNYKSGKVFYKGEPETVYEDNKDGLAIGISSIRESSDYIFLDVCMTDINYTCLYNKNNRETIVFEDVVADCFLKNNGISINWIIDNKLINVKDAQILKLLEEHYIDNDVQFEDKEYERKLKSILANLSEYDNPVLFIYELK